MSAAVITIWTSCDLHPRKAEVGCVRCRTAIGVNIQNYGRCPHHGNIVLPSEDWQHMYCGPGGHMVAITDVEVDARNARPELRVNR